ncbi:MAG TPA: OmpA family protein, partial [Myxococcaceae bacterium]|nr:OmpA family protein [Myxococcaceae bacterium]
MRGWLFMAVVLTSSLAGAQNPFDAAKQLAGDATTKKLEQEINKRLLAEGRKNQCSFKTDSDELMAG